MRLTIVALGQRMPAWVDAGVAEYVKRMPREHPLGIVELKPAPRTRGRSVEQLLDDEATRILAACAGSTLIALDERGRPWTTRELGNQFLRWRGEGSDIAFVIGSADGLAPSVKAKASATLALSAMTLPHGLCRVLLAEQLYRATSLVAGHPYHRE